MVALSGWDVDIFEVNSAGQVLRFKVSELIRSAARSFPVCDAPEDVNVALVSWSPQADIALLVAEVPPHSSCKNMGALRGFRIALMSKKILEVMPEPVLRRKWAHIMGEKLSKH
jgi:hypothetical protein